MRCAKIHDLTYDEALSVIQSLGPDSATPYDHRASDALARAYTVSEARQQFHGVHWREFCTDYGCDGWGNDGWGRVKVNRWSERVQRGW
jgi:hypothetical protein